MTVRIQMGPAGSDADPSNLAPEGPIGPTVRVVAGPVKVNQDGSVTETGVHRVNTFDLNNGASGIVGTARTMTGSPRLTAELKPTDRVVVNGMETTVQVAERMGLIHRDPSGRYSDKPQEAAPEAPPEAPPEEEALPSRIAEQELSELVGGVTGMTQITALGQIIEGGEVNTNTLNRAASEMGVHPDELGPRLARVVEGFREQAVQTLKGMGSGDPEAFFAWAHSERPNDMKQAMRQHAMGRNPKVYGELFKDYVASIGDRNPDALLRYEFGRGIKAQMVGKEVVLNVPGRGQIPYRVAVRTGLLTMRGV